MVIDDGVNGNLLIEGVPAGAGLTVDHDQSVVVLPANLVDGNEIDVEQIDHGLVFRPANLAVTGQLRRHTQTRFDEMSQAHHAAETVGIGLNVRDKSYLPVVGKTSQELIRTPSQADFLGNLPAAR